MLVPGNLGFQSFLLVFALIAFVVIRNKLRNVVAKKEEIMRLAAMASEEASMAEVEDTIHYSAYSSVPVFPRSQCAVCYRPTTMRCSQCKAVRYCSGKCQIIHWRHGHKDECYQPTASMQSDEGNDFDRQQRTDLPSSSTPLSSSFTPSDGESESYDVFPKEVLGADTFERPKKSLSSDVASDKLVLKSQSSKGKKPMSDDAHLANLANKKSTKRAILTEKDAESSTFRRPTSENVRCLRSDSVPDLGEDKSQLYNSKEVRSSLSYASKEHLSSTAGGNLALNSKVADSYHTLPAKFGGNASLPQSVSNGLKTSMRKVVQQFKVSKQSKSSLHALGNEVTVKYNCKLIFPYELFVELYCYDKVDLYPFGLTNCGNSCYANAVLQCLAFTRPLTSYLLRGIHSKACQKEWCFICEFECLVLQAREGTSPLSPVRILSKMHKIGSHLGHGRQEDAHEFLRYAVDAMQSVCLKEAGILGPLAEETTLVGLAFGGHLLSKIKCLKCLAKSERRERMMDLTVEIDGEIRTLEEALAQFTAAETLDRDNKYRCNRCKSYEKARKKLIVLEAPNILTIVLKRFQSGNFEKLNKSVTFPEILNMSPYMSGRSDDSPLYSLYGVVVHLDIMNDAFSGHYVCYVKNFHGDWFKIDDSMVEPVMLDRVLSQGAYMLLYARNSPRPPAVVRNNVASNGGKIKKRNLEAVPSSATKSMSRSSSSLQKVNTSSSHQTFDPDDWRFHSMQRIHGIDSSSESSSIFSSSDASSCSTVSTKDSVGTEDLSDYIFGEAGSNLYARYGISSDSVASSSYQNYGGNLKDEGARNSAILYTDSARNWNRLASTHIDSSSRGRGADFDKFIYGDSRSAVSSFNTGGDGYSAQTFY